RSWRPWRLAPRLRTGNEEGDLAQLSVIAIAGVRGAGKTELLAQLLANCQQYSVKVIVNDPSGRSQLRLRQNFADNMSPEDLIEINQGCVCCNQRAELAKILQNLKTHQQDT